MHRKNSYDFIRFLAASAVVLSHCFALSGRVEPIIGSITLGGLGVWIFFILSGYLITASWEQYPRFNVFVAKRSLRIFPALIVVTLITMFALGPFFTTITISEYFTSQQTLTYLNNVFLITPSFSLPGVFLENPYPSAVNGSIWTLSYEFLMYIVVAVLGALHVLTKPTALKIWTTLFVIQIIIIAMGASTLPTLFYFQINSLLTFALMFFCGVIAYKYRDSIRLSITHGIVSLGAFIAITLLLPTLTPLAAAILLAYALFALGSSPRFTTFSRFGDFSYGIYIYHFLIIQSVVVLFTIANPLVLFAIAWPLSVIAGAVSWRYIEAPALKLKRKINLQKYPLPQKDSAW